MRPDLNYHLQHAEGSSPFSGDGKVMHALAREIRLMRHFLESRRLDTTGLFSELEAYDRWQATQ